MKRKKTTKFQLKVKTRNIYRKGKQTRIRIMKNSIVNILLFPFRLIYRILTPLLRIINIFNFIGIPIGRHKKRKK